MPPLTRCARRTAHGSYCGRFPHWFTVILEWLTWKTMTERRQWDCTPQKEKKSKKKKMGEKNKQEHRCNIITVGFHHYAAWEMAFYSAKIFLETTSASLMMFWASVFTDRNEFDCYFFDASLLFLMAPFVQPSATKSISVFCTKVRDWFFLGARHRPSNSNLTNPQTEKVWELLWLLFCVTPMIALLLHFCCVVVFICFEGKNAYLHFTKQGFFLRIFVSFQWKQYIAFAHVPCSLI